MLHSWQYLAFQGITLEGPRMDRMGAPRPAASPTADILYMTPHVDLSWKTLESKACTATNWPRPRASEVACSSAVFSAEISAYMLHATNLLHPETSQRVYLLYFTGIASSVPFF